MVKRKHTIKFVGCGRRWAGRGARCEGASSPHPACCELPNLVKPSSGRGKKAFRVSHRRTVGTNRFFVTKSYISRSAKDIFNFFFLNEGDDLYNIGKLYPIWNFYILTSKNCLKCIFSKKQKNIAVFWNFLIFGWWDRHIRVQRMKIHRKSVGCLKKLLFFWVVFFVIFSKICMFRQVF